MKFTQSLKEDKIRKFQRDATDYNEGSVYSWKKRFPRSTDGDQDPEQSCLTSPAVKKMKA